MVKLDVKKTENGKNLAVRRNFIETRNIATKDNENETLEIQIN